MEEMSSQGEALQGTSGLLALLTMYPEHVIFTALQRKLTLQLKLKRSLVPSKPARLESRCPPCLVVKLFIDMKSSPGVKSRSMTHHVEPCEHSIRDMFSAPNPGLRQQATSML